MEPDPSPAFTRLQRHNVKRSIDPIDKGRMDFLLRKFRNKGRGARFGRGGGSERGRARLRYQEQKESEYPDQLAREVLDEHIQHLQQRQPTQQSNKQTSPIASVHSTLLSIRNMPC